MAQLKNTLISGVLKATEGLISKVFKAPSESNGINYTVGENGQVLKSNGTSNYWSNEDSYAMITQAIESGTTATNDYNKGDLLIMNNQLLRTTSAITIGTVITVGTSGNTEIIDLATIIKELNT